MTHLSLWLLSLRLSDGGLAKPQKMNAGHDSSKDHGGGGGAPCGHATQDSFGSRSIDCRGRHILEDSVASGGALEMQNPAQPGHRDQFAPNAGWSTRETGAASDRGAGASDAPSRETRTSVEFQSDAPACPGREEVKHGKRERRC